MRLFENPSTSPMKEVNLENLTAEKVRELVDESEKLEEPKLE